MVPELTNDVVPTGPLMLIEASPCRSTVPLLVTTELLPTYQVPFDTMLMMPALLSGRPSSTRPVMVMVVPLKMESRPLPLMVPLLVTTELLPTYQVPFDTMLNGTWYVGNNSVVTN